MIKLSVPEIDNKELQAIEKVLKSGWLIQGKEVKRFEKMVAKFIGVKYAIAVNSGTSAIYLSLLSLGIGKGDEVITSDFTFPATANVIELVNAKPVFVDIDLDTFNIDVSQIESKITPKTKAIIPVHLFGRSADMAPIIKLARKYKLKIIEDAACALGAVYKRKKCGGFSDLGCFSFHPRKTITTGDGGMIVTNNTELAEKLKLLRNHGMVRRKKKNDFISPGFNNRMTEMQAAMGIVQMNKLNKIIQKKQKIAKLYDKLLNNVNGIKLPRRTKNTNHVYQSYIVLLEKRVNRDKSIEKLKKQGIETGIATYALHELQYYKKKYSFSSSNFPNSKIAFKKALALPLYSGLTKKQIEYITNSLKKLV